MAHIVSRRRFGSDSVAERPLLRIAIELERVLGERVAISRTGGPHFGFGLPSDYDG